MMKKIVFTLGCILASTITKAQLDVYAAFTIPDSLKKNADAVVREEHIQFKIKDLNTAKYEVHKVITILNEDAKNELFFNEFSYKFRVLDDAVIKVYNAMGVKQNTYSKKEMTSLNYGEGLVPEGKVTYFSVNASSYPITIELNYTIKYRGILSYPDIVFQAPYQSVQSTSIDVEVPTELGLRYKILNCNKQPKISQEGKSTSYHWDEKNLPAYKIEKYVGDRKNVIPQALIAPNKFQLDDYEGDMTSWKNFGNWINSMYASTTKLSDERKEYFKQLTKDAKTDKDKAAILYQYLQTNMRYVSIQLGIGGLKPFPASFVDEKKYGDCKALSNFLKSALDAVGVKSNIVIIEGDSKPTPVFEDFPKNSFNHVILCMPQPKDTVWMECTSRTLPFGYLGPFTENRKAMLVTENGGVLVNTPISKMTDNVETLTTTITLNDEGGAVVNSAIQLTGDRRDDMLSYVHDMKEDEKRKYFIANYHWKQPDILNITTSSKNENPYQFKANMEYSKIHAFKAGSKYFFETKLYSIFNKEIPEMENRKHDYHFDMPYQIVDTTIFQLTKNYTSENLPTNKNILFPFANYTASYNYDAATNAIYVVTVLQIKQRIVKAADYPKLLDFKKQVLADVNEKIVLKKM